MKIVIGTRGSQLALAQTKWVMNELKKYTSELEFELKVIEVQDNAIQNQFLDGDNGKETFARAVEKALLNQTIDLAVHRMKDMPLAVPESLVVTGIPRREEVRDALILKGGYESLEDLPKGATLAARSKRRIYQLLAHRPDLNIVPIKGNMEIDIQEMEERGLDGVVQAAADMHYLGLQEKITCYLPMHVMMPAPTQGALAIEIKESHTRVKELLKAIEDPISTIQITAERAFMEEMKIDYKIGRMPIGAYCQVDGTNLRMCGLLGDEEGEKLVVKELSARVGIEKELGAELAKTLKRAFR